ncbi:MAG: tetratricopeptide repeat protein [Spirochaetota bacterium]
MPTNYNDIEAEDCYEMAMQWLRQGFVDKAIELLKKTIELNPNFIGAYIDVASVYAKKQRYNDAFHILKKASKIDTKFHKLNYLMAKYAYKNGDHLNAAKYIQRAIDISPEKLYLSAQKVITAKRECQ